MGCMSSTPDKKTKFAAFKSAKELEEAKRVGYWDESQQEYIVYGYFHRLQQEINLLNLPELVIVTCLEFYKLSWVITHEQKALYDAKFYALDIVNEKASGVQIMHVMLESKVIRDTLRKIWDLADLDEDGKMDDEEFALNMFLIDMVKDGNKLPETLPIHFIPPSKRELVDLSS